jgi:hypothetical protein
MWYQLILEFSFHKTHYIKTLFIFHRAMNMHNYNFNQLDVLKILCLTIWHVVNWLHKGVKRCFLKWCKLTTIWLRIETSLLYAHGKKKEKVELLKGYTLKVNHYLHFLLNLNPHCHMWQTYKNCGNQIVWLLMHTHQFNPSLILPIYLFVAMK